MFIFLQTTKLVLNNSDKGKVTMIDRETVENVAKLARLGLNEEEIKVFGEQLSVILQNIAILQEADVSGVSPTSHASRLTNVMREDIPEPSYPPELLLANAPDREDNYLKVPPVLEGEA
jgi:aspartyl-tRNA(Asn)/glutamyl-tRNA(Gln) amidotransferase subunit C